MQLLMPAPICRLRLTPLSVLSLLLMMILNTAQAGPKIEHWTTTNGLRVLYVAAPQLPMLDIRLTFAAGSARDGDTPGLAMFTSSMLNDGADGLNADELAEAFESVGAIYGAGSARDMAWVSLRTLTLEKELESALATWVSVLGKPEFPEKEFQNAKKLALVGLQAEKQSPSSLASKAYYKALYGEHPYASPQNGTVESVEALTRKQLVEFYRQYYVSRNGILALVGAINRPQAEKLASRIAAALPEGRRAVKLPEVKPLAEARTIHIPYPSAQAHIMLGQPGTYRGDPDYFPLYLGNHILGGGGFTSRLMKEVRDQRGLSYSVYSYFSPMEQQGPFQIGLQTQVAQTDEALQVVHDTLDTFLEAGPGDKELEAAKKDITGGFPLNIASNANILGYLAMIGFYDLPLDYLDTFTDNIEALSREQVTKTFQHRLNPDKMLTVIVGGEAKDDAQTAPQTREPASPDETGN